ncbi:MAG: hypothetical protein ACREUK_07765 [Burkholderiales bacterium]
MRRLGLALGWGLVAAIVYGSVMHSPPSLGWISALVFPAARARAR